MSIINGLGLIGVGYILCDNKYKNGDHRYEDTLRCYFKNVLMDKMDILFYGATAEHRHFHIDGHHPKPRYRSNYTNYSHRAIFDKNDNDEEDNLL